MTYSVCEDMQVCSCLSPVYIDTPDGGVYVPCGHCSACLSNKGLARRTSLDICLSHYVSVFLVTLTFSNSHLRFADWSDDEFAFLSDETDYLGRNYRSDYNLWCDDKSSFALYDYCKQHYDGRLPVLSHRLAILFKKRFRKNLSKVYNEKVFIYLCGEYGASKTENFRPHYHCLLCFPSVVSRDFVEELVFKSWQERSSASRRKEPIGFCDVRLCAQKGYSSYVTSYVTCTSDLPKILSRGQFKPFFQSSRQCEYRGDYYGVSEQEYFDKPSFERSVSSLRDGSPDVVRVPSFLVSRVYPKHKAFGLITLQDRVRIAQFVSLFPCFEQFYDYCLNAFDGGLVLSFIRDVVMFDVPNVKVCLYKFYLVFRRYVRNAVRFGVSLVDYFNRLDLYWSKYELFKLRKFYQFLEDFSKVNPVTSVLACYYNTVGMPYDFRSLPSFKHYSLLMRSINQNLSKTHKRNDYFSRHNLLRPVCSTNPLITRFL